MDRNVKFIDINKLWELVERYMPVKAVMQKLGEVNKVFNNLDTHFRPTAILNNQGISLGIAEKFPGASREKPFNIGMTFNFPNTEEGQLAKSAFERSFATGVPVDIRSPYIKSIEFPESFSQLLGKEAIPSSIHIESINNQIYLLARMEFISDDGDRFVLDYVHFTVAQSGTEESTLTNENQPTPIQIKLILFLKQQRASIQFHFQADQVNVHQILDAVNLFNIASKPMTVKITDLNTGIIMFTQHYDKGVCGSPDSALVEMFKDLNEIQIKLQRPIFYPNRQLTSEEENTIGLLRTIFHERGKVTTGWEAITISLTQEGAKHSVEKFKDGKTDYVKLTGQEMITLFGIDLPLGETEVIIENACLRNEDEVLTRLTQAISENEVIDCEFIPMNGSAIRKQYLNWQ
jgi:hypothetical protein